MSKPICCGKPATPCTKVYKSSWWPSVESGFRCKVCGRIRIPFGQFIATTIRDTFSDEQWTIYQENLRAEGIA